MGEASTIRCAKCGYDLRATPSLKCPECGTTHVPGRRRPLTGRDWTIAAAMNLAAAYLPWMWVFFNDRARQDLANDPLVIFGMPAGILAALLGVQTSTAAAMIAGLVLAAAVCISVRDWTHRVIVTAVLLLGSGLSSALSVTFGSIVC